VARLREDLEIARGKLAALDPNATLQDLKSFKDAKALLRKTIPTRPATAPPRPPIPATAPPPAPSKATNRVSTSDPLRGLVRPPTAKVPFLGGRPVPPV